MLLAGLALVYLLACSSRADAGRFPTRYDGLIRTAVHRWWPRHELAGWEWFKAQLYQESLLSPDAVSPVGARGLAQFMPATWAEVCSQLGTGLVSPHVAEHSVNAGAYYMARLWLGWSSPRPEADRWDLARASYNAGFGNMLKAQKKSGGAILYTDIIAALPSVTGHHAKETQTYVERIHHWHKEIRGGR
ncbi:transglycosylase SLT domain-containing protein [Pseudodesulfovibrio aespoeensis]|nr:MULTISPECIES: transglycosylase SLT domain-containing protein [Pseudodesulfovibrio]